MTVIQDLSLAIRPISEADLAAVLDIYRQCEDFLVLGPVSDASMAMVLGDIGLSQACGGSFCGIYITVHRAIDDTDRNDSELSAPVRARQRLFAGSERMIGIVDYVPGNYEGDPHAAYIALLMIAGPFRRQGIGQAVVEAIEHEIRRDAQINKILAGVQANNPQAIRFWQRNGYRIIGEPALMSDRTTVYHLRKDLTSPIAPEPTTHHASCIPEHASRD